MSMKETPTIFETIKYLSEKQNVTLASLERRLGFSKGTISRFRQNKPTLSQLYVLAYYFKVDVEELIGDNGEDSYKHE